MDGRRRSIVLVEPTAHQAGGHWGENLARLTGHGLPGVRTVVVVPGGLHPDVDEVIRGRAEVVDVGAEGTRVQRTLLHAARGLEWLRAQLRGRFPRRWWADQPALVARLLVEVACLRAARAASAAGDAVVVLTANEVLHSAAALGGATGHQRFVHEFSMRHGRWFAPIDRWCARAAPPTVVLCPTEGVRRQVVQETPHVDASVRTFAVTGALAPLDGSVRGRLMAELGLPEQEPVLALLGGWWDYKDHDVVTAAIESMDRRISLIVVGDPLDDALLDRIRRRLGPSLAVLGGSVSSTRYSEICAAVDAIVVSRRPEICKESGLLMDAVRHGTPVVMSDNDPELVATVGTRPWVRLFRTGDASSLRDHLESLEVGPTERPDDTDAARLGMRSPAEAVDAFLATAAS